MQICNKAIEIESNESFKTPFPFTVQKILERLKDSETCETCKVMDGKKLGKGGSLDVWDVWYELVEKDHAPGVFFNRHSKTSYDRNFKGQTLKIRI